MFHTFTLMLPLHTHTSSLRKSSLVRAMAKMLNWNLNSSPSNWFLIFFKNV